MKNVLFAFTTACFLFACHQSGIKKSMSTPKPADCMAQVIALDDSLGKARNHACEAISLSETIRNYADGMWKMSYAGCPEAFSTAFKKHREAWLALIPITDKYPDLRGEMHVLFKKLESGPDSATFKPMVKTVWDTWAEVEAAMNQK